MVAYLDIRLTNISRLLTFSRSVSVSNWSWSSSLRWRTMSFYYSIIILWV